MHCNCKNNIAGAAFISCEMQALQASNAAGNGNVVTTTQINDYIVGHPECGENVCHSELGAVWNADRPLCAVSFSEHKAWCVAVTTQDICWAKHGSAEESKLRNTRTRWRALHSLSAGRAGPRFAAITSAVVSHSRWACPHCCFLRALLWQLNGTSTFFVVTDDNEFALLPLRILKILSRKVRASFQLLRFIVKPLEARGLTDHDHVARSRSATVQPWALPPLKPSHACWRSPPIRRSAENVATVYLSSCVAVAYHSCYVWCLMLPSAAMRCQFGIWNCCFTLVYGQACWTFRLRKRMCSTSRLRAPFNLSSPS